MKKILTITTAIVASIIFMVLTFVFPVFWKWYEERFALSALSGGLMAVPVFISFFFWIGLIAGMGYLWYRCFNNENK